MIEKEESNVIYVDFERKIPKLEDSLNFELLAKAFQELSDAFMEGFENLSQQDWSVL